MRQRYRDEREDEAGPAAPALAVAAPVSNRALAHLLQRSRAPADAAEAKRSRDEARQGLDGDRRRLLAALTEGRRHPDTVTRNSVEWLELGVMGVKLYAVRKTGDSAERAPKDQAAFFPQATEGVAAGHVHDPTLPDYAWQDLDDQTGVSFNAASAGGWNTDSGRQIAIEVAGSSDADVLRAIKHEVQHAADRHHGALETLTARAGLLGGQTAALEADRLRSEQLMGQGTEQLDGPSETQEEVTAREAKFDAGLALSEHVDSEQTRLGAETKQLSAQKAFEAYKTEYRAYSYMGDEEYAKLAVEPGFFTDVLEAYGHDWTPRQYAILDRILTGYAEVKTHFAKDSTLLDGRRFRAAVHAYRLPDEEGFNKLNSVRVNAIFDSLRAVPPNTANAQDDRLLPLLTAVELLTKEEAAYLADPKESAALGRLMRERLTGKAYEQVRKAILARAPFTSRFL